MDIKNFQELYQAGENNTLLTGSGFNIKFGHSSSYRYIFQIMADGDPKCYNREFRSKVAKCGHNLEKVLEHCSLLEKKSITTDFIKSLINVVRDAEEGTESAAGFIKKFNKIFTLNYDPFLYKIGLCLDRQMQQVSSQYKEEFTELETGLQGVEFPNDKWFDDFSKTTQSYIMAACTNLPQKTEFRKEAMTYLQRSENPTQSNWQINDGFQKEGKELLWRASESQNIFYLHGALHIYKEEGGQEIKKIAVGRMDTLRSKICSRLDQSIKLDCIFSDDNKIEDIKQNSYMADGLERLGQISGNIFLYGVGLNENDNHIWSAIANNNAIKRVYISFLRQEDEKQGGLQLTAERTGARAKKFFSEKDIVLFDSETID